MRASTIIHPARAITIPRIVFSEDLLGIGLGAWVESVGDKEETRVCNHDGSDEDNGEGD